MLNFPDSLRAHLRIAVGLLALVCAPVAFGQNPDFSLLVTTQLPPATDPGGTPGATLALETTDGFTGSVALSCIVSSSVTVTNPPMCAVSPPSATAPSSPSLTFITTSSTTPNTYTVTVTGVSGADTATVKLTPIQVSDVTALYTLAIGTALTPSSLHAGSGATAVLNITSSSGYSGMVTPGCSSITPAVEPSPICSFNPPTVTVANGVVANSTLNISTTGTSTKTTGSASTHARAWYALLIPLPFMVLAGFAAGHRRSGLRCMFGLCLAAAGLMVLPSCGTSKTVTNGSVTPNNSYTFTITSYDVNGVAASNTSVTVSLTVN